MQRYGIQPIVRSTVIFILVAEAARGSDISLVNIPFSFCVGKTAMDSGCYEVHMLDDRLRLTNGSGKKAADSVFLNVSEGGESAAGTLVFIESGERYLLSKVFWPAKSCDLEGRSELSEPVTMFT